MSSVDKRIKRVWDRLSVDERQELTMENDPQRGFEFFSWWIKEEGKELLVLERKIAGRPASAVQDRLQRAWARLTDAERGKWLGDFEHFAWDVQKRPDALATIERRHAPPVKRPALPARPAKVRTQPSKPARSAVPAKLSAAAATRRAQEPATSSAGEWLRKCCVQTAPNMFTVPRSALP